MSQLSFQEFGELYREHRPDRTALYQAVASHYRTFLTLAEESGRYIPKYVTREFEAFLRCGILAHGFLRVRCEDCHHEKLVAFSCKKRGFCTSCGGRRMAETAAHLVDSVFPRVGVRQYVLSFPMPVRFILAKNPKIQAKCLTIVHRAITAFIKTRAKRQGFRSKLQPGAVTLIQRFGGSLNLNVHFHMLFLDGGFYLLSPDVARFWWVPPPRDQEIAELTETIAKRVVRFLKKKGYFQDDCYNSIPEEEMSQAQDELLPELQAASVQSRIAMGERRGQRVRRLGCLEARDYHAELEGDLCANSVGFSLHAAVYCAPFERGKLEKLCRYVARPALAEGRLQLRPSGDLILKLKTRYSDGTTHLLFSGLEFIEKLAALIPQPRIHLTRYFGCLAPHAKIRRLVVPKTEEPDDPEAKKEVGAGEEPRPTHRIPWADLLERVFSIDFKHCPQCGGAFKPIAAILEPDVIHKILTHLRLPTKPPDIAPARLAPQLSF
jgi:hypothetical protein